MIAFVGSVFSPTYFRARRRHIAADPTAHCGFNVVVHGERGSSWAFSEYRGTEVERSADRLVLGRNQIDRSEHGLRVIVDERTSPWGRPLRGQIRLESPMWMPDQFALDDAGRHVWWPVAPQATIHVDLEQPKLRFVGTGYHDSNRGIEPLEQAFSRWTWSRSTDAGGTSLLYDVTASDGVDRRLGLRYGGGAVEPIEPSAMTGLGRSRWGLSRHTRVAPGGHARLQRTLVDTPFYARSIIETDLAGAPAIGIHEVVDLERFARTTTQLMLPFRTRGAQWW